MVQFIRGGPDIPDGLVQAHEEGRVVFFCGAGISRRAGLPGFRGLVNGIYHQIGTDFKDIERETFKRGEFDFTLDRLEERLPEGRPAVRRALAQVLKPRLRRKGAIDTHSALLQLARSRDHEGALRLVTTNFDRLFHVAAKRTGQRFQTYAAPALPVPKNSRWDGLVYLHGLLTEGEKDTDLNRLVVTSGDFGNAYLNEAWAARFVSELFRSYEVCFVGYSIGDTVMRYMMHALAVDRGRGENTPQVWALVDCKPEQEEQKTREWEARGVNKPILYTVPTGSDDHSALHQTLYEWAKIYRDGVQGKEAIVTEYALTRPQHSTCQDNFVGRMLWALSDQSGSPMRRFADFNPVPALDWLECLEKYRPVPPLDWLERLKDPFSGPGYLTPHLARWLLRHLDDPKLFLWMAERGGGKLHDSLIWRIDERLDELVSLEREGKTSWLDEIRSQAPRAIPRPMMRTLWGLLTWGRVKKTTRYDPPALPRWERCLKREGRLTTTLRLALRELLAPRIAFRKAFCPDDDDSGSDDGSTRIRQPVDCDLVLAADHVYLPGDIGHRKSSSEPGKSPPPLQLSQSLSQSLPDLLEDFQHLLRDGLDLLRDLGEADDRSDRSYFCLPSIEPHRQNSRSSHWVILIELLRDAWLEVASKDSARATDIAQGWFHVPYPTFRRLALFAASQDGCIPTGQWVDWLVAEDAWWLWSAETWREVCRLLVWQGKQLDLDRAAQERLETAILAGPPREMCRRGVEEDKWREIATRYVWLLLAKLDKSGLVLGQNAAAHLEKISTDHPKFKLDKYEREEFFPRINGTGLWMSGTGFADYEENEDIAPRTRKELVRWLERPLPEPDPWTGLDKKDTWREVCCTRFFHALSALCDLAHDDQWSQWPAERWGQALCFWAWAKEGTGTVLRSWRYAAPLVRTMPEHTFREIAGSVAPWVEAASRSINCHEEILLELCERVLNPPFEAGGGFCTVRDGKEVCEAVNSALNHPVGQVTRALIRLCFKRRSNDNDRLPDELKPIFTRLCDVSVERFRHGRVFLAINIIGLFRLDPDWTRENLLPRLDWQQSKDEARSAWEGFLCSPRTYPPLLEAVKPFFLETAKHYEELGESRQQFAAFLTYAALRRPGGYDVNEFKSAIGKLPQEGLEASARALCQALAGAGDQCEAYWQNRALPFWRDIWPKSVDLASKRIAIYLAELVIAARGKFPQALDEVQSWLQPLELPNCDYVVDQLHQFGLCERFPGPALSLLDKVVDNRLSLAPAKLGQCLDQIEKKSPQSAKDPRFRKLREHWRKYGDQ